MLRFALFSPPDEGPPLFKDHHHLCCVNHRVVSEERDYCTQKFTNGFPLALTKIALGLFNFVIQFLVQLVI